MAKMVRITERFKRGFQKVDGTFIKEDGKVVTVQTQDGIREILEKRISSIVPLKNRPSKSAHEC